MATPNRIYVGQTKLTFYATVNVDIAGAQEMKIKYKKPVSGTEGFWTATEEAASAGILKYNVASTSILDEAGVWILWGWVKDSNGKVAPGDPFKITVYEEGQP